MAAFLTFRSIRKFVAPRWLTTGEGGLVGYALDLVKDAFVERLALGRLARLPQNDATGAMTAPSDALTAMGRDRRVQRGLFETDVEYAARLVRWLVDRRTAGNPYTLMRQLHAYVGTTHGVSFRTVDVRGNWYSRSATGVETASLSTGLWDWDGDPASWSRFWVIIYPGTLWNDGNQIWGDPATQAWGDPGHVWGVSNMTPEQATTLRSIVTDWKPAGTRCQNIIIAFDPASFDPATPEPNGSWGKWGKVVGGVRVRARLSTARYLSGR